jgi:hypothetical protein
MIGLLFTAAGLGVAVAVLGSLHGLARRWLAIGIAIVVMAPWFVWQAVFPPPIELTAYSETVDYEFRDRAYAEEFAALNGAKTDADPEEQGSDEPPAE